MNDYGQDFITKQKRLRLRNEGCACASCGSLFTVDLIVEDTLWNVIKPAEGILCGSCIMRRIEVESDFYAFELKDLIRGENSDGSNGRAAVNR